MEQALVGGVRLLYSILTEVRPGSEAARELWQSHFERVHGPLERKRVANRRTLAKKHGLDADSIDLGCLLMAVETGLALHMKASAAGALAASGLALEMPAQWTAINVRGLLDGSLFEDVGVQGYGDSELFEWIADCASGHELHDLMTGLTAGNSKLSGEELLELDEYRFLYHALVPKEIRHTIGAYFTPRWLAEHVLCELGYSPGADRLLDPTCGSGVFLNTALRQILQSEQFASNPHGALQAGLGSVAGIDINPIASLAARTGFIYFIATLVGRGAVLSEPVNIPIYRADSVAVPERAVGEPLSLFDEDTTEVRLEDAVFRVPAAMLSSESWARAMTALRSGVPTDPDTEFLPHVQQLRAYIDSLPEGVSRRFALASLAQIAEPANMPRFDVVAGNPPWVNWEHLPPAYRDVIAPLWPRLGLFGHSGRDRSFSKEDVSVLVTYAAADRYLKDGGRLGFLLPQSLFKASLNGRGFRRFCIGTHTPLRVDAVDDLVAANPFRLVNNRTAALFLTKGEATVFPVVYRRWELNAGNIDERASLDHALELVSRHDESAMPIDDSSGAPWMTGSRELLDFASRVSGKSAYKARTGIFTGGLNAAYYFELLEVLDDGKLRLRNMTARAKIRLDTVEIVVEPDYVFPLLRGRDVSQWSARPELVTICPHNAESRMRAIPEHELRGQAPLTLKYFESLRAELESRKGFVGWEKQYHEASYYAAQRIGDYTFAPFKVVWRYISREFTTAVVEPGFIGTRILPVMPHEKLMLVGFDDPVAAYFLGGMLAATQVKQLVESRMIGTQIAPSIINEIAIPEFDAQNELHLRISSTCARAQVATKAHDDDSIQECQREIDDAVAEALGAVLAQV